MVRVRELGTGKLLAEFSDHVGWGDPATFPRDHLARFTPDGRYSSSPARHFAKVWDWRNAAPDPQVIGDRKSPAPTTVALVLTGR